MGFLDDLRNQANKKKQDEHAEAKRWEQLTQDYRENIHPKMANLYSHLNELIEHLKVVNPEIKTDYILTASGDMATLKQQEHKIVTDSAEEMKEILFKCVCAGDKKIKYEVENKKNIDKHIEYLQRYNLKFDSRLQRNDSHEVTHAKITVEPAINMFVLIKGDIESGQITIKFSNVEALGTREHTFRPEQVDDEFVDNVIKYIMRNTDHFLQLEMSDNAKRKIQQRIKLEKLQRERELREAERRYEEEQKKSNR